MGLPEVIVIFQTKGLTAIQRSGKGIVALILKDDTGTFDTKEYKSIVDINAADWTAANKDYIELAFLGTPSKVIVERIPTTATDYNAALTRLKVKKWNYLAIPGIAAADVATIVSWIKTERDTNKKSYKFVAPSNAADHEGIQNFSTDNIKRKGVTTPYTTAQYTARIAGILGGLPFTRSATYYVLDEVESITESADPNADIDAGKLILVNDGTKIKIGRAVNSLVTTTATKGKAFKKIKIMEGVDLMREDIRDTFNDFYAGRVINNYDNKVLFVGATNAYFKTIAGEDVLDSNYDNKAMIDTEAQRLFLESSGINTENMTEQEIKEANTDSSVFVGANVKFADAMEDLKFSVSM